MNTRPDTSGDPLPGAPNPNAPMLEMLARLQAFCASRLGSGAPFRLVPEDSSNSHRHGDLWEIFPNERLMLARSTAGTTRARIDALTQPTDLNAYRRARRTIRRLVERTPFSRHAGREIAICPGLSGFAQAVLLGTGTRAKLFDFNNQVVYHVPVTRSGLVFFETEVNARLDSIEHVPGPRLIEHEFGEVPYFKEELVSGTPWSGDPRSDRSHIQLLSRLADMYRAKGTEGRSAADYLSELGAQLKRLADDCGRSTPGARELIESLSDEVDRLGLANSRVTLVTAHGDFTAKNILVEDKSSRAVLLDWEYAGRATMLHDAIHFAAVPMLERGDSSLLSDLVSGEDAGPMSRLLAALGSLDVGFDGPEGLRVMVGIYYLEREIRFLDRLAAHSGADSNMALRFDRAVDTIEAAIRATDGGRDPGKVKERLVGASFG